MSMCLAVADTIALYATTSEVEVQMAKNLLYYVERSGSLKPIAESENVGNYDEFEKILK